MILKNLIRNYPLIKVETTVIDRQRSLDKIQLVGDELGKPVYFWSLLQPEFQPLVAMGASFTARPIARMIESIGALQATTNGLYVFENLFTLID